MEKEIGWLKSDFLGEDERRHAAAHALGIPFVMLGQEDLSHEALMLIPEPLARAHNIVAFRLQDGGLEVALLDIADLTVLEQLPLPHKVLPRLTDTASMRRALLYYQKILKEKFSGMLEQGLEAADSLIKHALLSRASHIHLDPHAAAMIVRYRIGGTLQEAMRLSEKAGRILVERLKSLAKLFPGSTFVQEGKFKVEHQKEITQVHVSTVPLVSGEKVLLRLARESSGQKGFALPALGFHGRAEEEIHHALGMRSGLILVCGIEGSGKTTLLYTLLDLLSSPGRSIATVEENIEYRLPRASQTQSSAQPGLSFAALVRGTLKQDPDVLMISDVVDSETAALAASAASRGVLVLAGVKAGSATEGIEKFLAQGISPLLVASTLRAAVGVRLVQKLPKEREKHHLARVEIGMLEKKANLGRVLATLKEEKILDAGVAWKDLQFYRPSAPPEAGAPEGFVGLQEVLPVTSTIQELILRNAAAGEIEAQAQEEGMLNLQEDAIFKAAQGLAGIEEIIKLL